MNSYNTLINDIYAVLSGDYADHFLGIDEVLEEVPLSSDFVIRPSYNFGTNSQFTNLREIENDLIINLQLFKEHDSNTDLVEIAEDIRDKVKELHSFVYQGYKFGINTINLVKNFDSKYIGVTVQILTNRLEQVIYEKPDWSTYPLTFVAGTQNSTVKLTQIRTMTSTKNIQYRIGEGSWQAYIIDTEILLRNEGDYVSFQNLTNTFSESGTKYFQFVMTGKIYAKGKISSLLNNSTSYLPTASFLKLFMDCDCLISMPIIDFTDFRDASCSNMFLGCSLLVETEPITVNSVSGTQTFYMMFGRCVALEKTPIVNINALGNNATCQGMFSQCANLKEFRGHLLEDPNYNIPSNCYYQMFQYCFNLRIPPRKIIGKSLGSNGCYIMFQYCTTLEYTPEINFKEIGTNSYYGMFNACYNLKTFNGKLEFTSITGTASMRAMFSGDEKLEIPNLKIKLPETISGNSNAFYDMFSSCKKLYDCKISGCKTASADSGFYQMFNGCDNLTKVEVDFTSWPTGTNATYRWLNNVKSSGEFICPTALPEVRGINNIPNNWTITRK